MTHVAVRVCLIGAAPKYSEAISLDYSIDYSIGAECLTQDLVSGTAESATR